MPLFAIRTGTKLVRRYERVKSGEHGASRDQIYEEARRLGIRGRSLMDQTQLERAVMDRKS